MLVSMANMLSAFILLTVLVAPTVAHQKLSTFLSTSKENKCSDFFNCQGRMCPNEYPQRDVNKHNPRYTLKRGQLFRMPILRNNHIWGFARYSFVSVSDMQSEAAHAAGTFYYVCGDSYEKLCEPWRMRRDCRHDRGNKMNEHRIRIPTHLRDGVYVLGWVWFGSVFEDSRDCTYMRIKGGATLTQSATPVFSAVASQTGEGGKCLATSDKPGVCNDGSCLGFEGKKKLRQVVPFEFADGPPTRRLLQSESEPFIAPPTAVRVRWLRLVDADNPSDIKAQVGYWVPSIRMFKVCLDNFRPTIVCGANGPVKAVLFMRDGWPYGPSDKVPPYDMEKSPGDGTTLVPLNFKYSDTFFTVTCYAFNEDKSEESWLSVGISTQGQCTT